MSSQNDWRAPKDYYPVVLTSGYVPRHLRSLTDNCKDPRRCPTCQAVIDACHDAAQLRELLDRISPESTVPPQGAGAGAGAGTVAVVDFDFVD